MTPLPARTGPLRIAIWHNLPSGGGKRQLYMHVQGLLQRGHYVESWCPETADQKYLPLSTLITEHIVPLKNRSDLFSSPTRPLGVTRQLLASMEEQCRECASAINAGGFDVLFAGACMFLRTTPIAGMVKVPSAIYLGEPYRWFYEAMPELPWIAPATTPGRFSLRSLWNGAARRSQLDSIRTQARAELEYLKSFDVVLANSVFSRETILRTYNIESRVCLLGVDSDYYTPTGEPKEPFVVGLGTIYHGKGVDRAIRAVGAVERSIRPALVWIGNGAWEEELNGYKRLARKLDVEFIPRVHIPDSEVISVLSRATAMIFTSRLEPFGLAPLEANACGTPVVAIAEGGVRESIADGVNGFLAADDNPRQLGALIERFVADPSLAATMGAQAREHVRTHWSLDRCTDTIESALLTTIAAAPTKPLLADETWLRQLQPTGDVRSNIESLTIGSTTLHAKGWAFIDDEQGAIDSEIFILVRSASGARLFKTVKASRPDVTSHFGGTRDYDDSGFSVRSDITAKKPFDVGILIVRATRIGFHIL